MGGPVRRSSTASKKGSGLSTIPAPPPYGESSTVWCLSCVKSRSCTTRTFALPASTARPTMLVAAKGAIMSGNNVTTLIVSIRSIQQTVRHPHHQPPLPPLHPHHELLLVRQQELPLGALHLDHQPRGHLVQPGHQPQRRP